MRFQRHQQYQPLKGFALVMAIALSLSGCGGSSPHSRYALKHDGPPLGAFSRAQIIAAKPRPLPLSPYGNPKSYVVNGVRYHVLKTIKNYNMRGIASWYGRKFQNALTSTREPFNMYAMTAASPVLPIPCFVRVTNLSNGRHAIVKVNDRGPFAPNRILDLSYAAAKQLKFARHGTALVEVTTINFDGPQINAHFPSIYHHPRLYLQVAAFQHKSNAEHLKSRLTSFIRKTIRIEANISDHHRIYRVKIGPLHGVSESDTLIERLTCHGFSNVITTIS